MLRSHVVVTTLVGCLLGGLLWCDAFAQTHEATLDECIAIAKSNNPTLRIAAIDEHVSRLMQDEIRTTSMPVLRFESGAFYAPHSGAFGYDHALSNGGQLAGKITLAQSLYDGGARHLRIDQLGLDIERHSFEQQAIERDLVLSVTQSYFDVLHARALFAAHRESESALASYLDLVTTMNAAGTASSSDVLKTRVDLDAERIATTRASDLNDASIVVLLQKLGLPPSTQFQIAGTLDSAALPVIPQLESDTSPHTVDTKIAELDIASGRAEMALGETERKASVAIGADAGLWTSVDNLTGYTTPRTSVLGVSAGIAMGLPLSSWGAFDLRAQQRELNVQQRQERLQLLTRSIASDRRTIGLQMRAAFQRLTALQQTIVSARDNVALITSRYNAGAAISLDVLTSMQTLFQLRTDAIDAKADIHQFAAQLARLHAE